MSQELPDWPPELSKDKEEYLTKAAIDYAFGHSLIVRHAPGTSGSTIINAPFSLYPTPFPRELFNAALKIQPLYNKLYARITNDYEFLQMVIGGAVVKVDSFQASLWSLYNNLREQGSVQPITLGIFRSDYLIHASNSSRLTLQQVELNTIASSFGPLGSKTTQLHKYLLQSGLYPAHQSLSESAIPDNDAHTGLVEGIFQAHKLYGNPSAYMLTVIQPDERNVFDQKALEFSLMAYHGIRTIRASFDELEKIASLEGSDRRLVLKGLPIANTETVEISVIYYRAGYSPNDYQNPSNWSTRLLLEHSKAIKCPSVALQLAGAKKVQQVLTRPGVLERFMDSAEEVEALKSTFTRLLPLDDSEDGKEALRLIQESNGEGFVLKPQREGGGNNIYGTDIPKALEEMSKRDQGKWSGSNEDELTEKEGYILMDLINPPKKLQNILVKKGTSSGVQSEIMSELGVYGVTIWNDAPTKPKIFVNETAGHLLRTKASDVNEGGVATGFSVVDSPLLV